MNKIFVKIVELSDWNVMNVKNSAEVFFWYSYHFHWSIQMKLYHFLHILVCFRHWMRFEDKGFHWFRSIWIWKQKWNFRHFFELFRKKGNVAFGDGDGKGRI